MQPVRRGAAFFDAAMFASPEAIGRASLLGDSNASRLSEVEQKEAVREALADGAAVAEETLSRFGSMPPDLLAGRFGVCIETSSEPALLGPLWRLADYSARPRPCITLYREGIAVVEAVAREPPTADLLGASTPQQILIAHELYHHIETTRPQPPISRRWQVTLIKLGRWRWQSGLPVLSEIAAGAFAQTLLRLPMHPQVLDLVVLLAVNGEASAAHAGSRMAALCRGGLPQADYREKFDDPIAVPLRTQMSGGAYAKSTDRQADPELSSQWLSLPARSAEFGGDATAAPSD